MNMIDDEFKVAHYIDPDKHRYAGPINNLDKIAQAIDWSKESMRTIILPTDTLEELEDDWIEFNSMIKKHRRESDWKSIELFGLTNQERYESLRSAYLSDYGINELEQEFDKTQLIQSGDTPIIESYIDTFMNDPYYESDSINYTSLEVEKARKWADESNRTIIIPTRTLQELETLWDAYSAMHHKHCRESDWMSLELFGVTNLKHYEYLKNQFLKQDVNSANSEKYGSVVEYTINPDMNRYFKELSRTVPSIEVVRSLLELSLPKKSIYEERIVSNVINTTIDTIGDISEVIPNAEIPYGDLPFFTPEDMIDMGISASDPEDNFYGVFADNTHINDTITVAEWFEMYRATYDGFYTEFTTLSADWVNKVRYLMHGLNRIKESGDENAIKARKQSILELGWNPDIEFTDKARIVARECTIHKMTSRNSVTKVIDLRGFRTPDIQNISLNEETSTGRLYPVYIVLTEGNNIVAKTIKGVTNSIYSHASIAFDSILDKMYSFGPINKNGSIGGFREENIKNVPNGCRMGLFTFFVPKDIYQKIVDMVNMFKENIDKTKYGYKNIITYLFNIPYNTDWRLICSQFVDRCLKYAGIDITNRDSSLLSPEDINKAAKNEKRIYNVYQGLASKYDGHKIKNLINSLIVNARSLKEYSIYNNDEISYITGILTNINDVITLREMRSNIDLINNESTRRLLEDILFDSLEIRSYCEGYYGNESIEPSMDFIREMIIKNMKPMV